MKLYVASSWRNRDRYREVLAALRADGHECYDFRNPWPGNEGFKWADVEKDGRPLERWDNIHFARALQHPIAQRGFRADFEAMHWAEGCVLVLPCGRSAHLEAGWFCGQGKPCWIYAAEPTEPELMYLMARFAWGPVKDLTDQINREQVTRLTGGPR